MPKPKKPKISKADMPPVDVVTLEDGTILRDVEEDIEEGVRETLSFSAYKSRLWRSNRSDVDVIIIDGEKVKYDPDDSEHQKYLDTKVTMTATAYDAYRWAKNSPQVKVVVTKINRKEIWQLYNEEEHANVPEENIKLTTRMAYTQNLRSNNEDKVLVLKKSSILFDENNPDHDPSNVESISKNAWRTRLCRDKKAQKEGRIVKKREIKNYGKTKNKKSSHINVEAEAFSTTSNSVPVDDCTDQRQKDETADVASLDALDQTSLPKTPKQPKQFIVKLNGIQLFSKQITSSDRSSINVEKNQKEDNRSRADYLLSTHSLFNDEQVSIPKAPAIVSALGNELEDLFPEI